MKTREQQYLFALRGKVLKPDKANANANADSDNIIASEK
jgi:hypothetical protein